MKIFSMQEGMKMVGISFTRTMKIMLNVPLTKAFTLFTSNASTPSGFHYFLALRIPLSNLKFLSSFPGKKNNPGKTLPVQSLSRKNHENPYPCLKKIIKKPNTIYIPWKTKNKSRRLPLPPNRPTPRTCRPSSPARKKSCSVSEMTYGETCKRLEREQACQRVVRGNHHGRRTG